MLRIESDYMDRHGQAARGLGGLGIIDSRNEAQRSLTGFAGASGCFGDVPNDFQAGIDRGYTPVWQEWVYGYGVNPGYAGKVYRNINGLAGVIPSSQAMLQSLGVRKRLVPTMYGLGQDTATEAIAELTKTQKRVALLQTISTASIVAIAVAAIAKVVMNGKKR